MNTQMHTAAAPPKWPTWPTWLTAGVALFAIHVALVAVAWRYAGDDNLQNQRLAILTALAVLAGAIYLLVVRALRTGPATTGILAWIVLVAAGMRAVMWFSPPIPNADYWRYFWDGAVTAHRLSPYRYTPNQALATEPACPEIHPLATRGQDVLERISHPHLRTIYPPVAQALFALAHRLTPFQITGWRIVLLACDLLTAAVVVGLLHTAKRPLTWLAAYAWNPLLINETYYGGHLDLIAGAAVLLVAWALTRRRSITAAGALAAAVGAKLWPAILAVFLLRPHGRRAASWHGWSCPAVFILLAAALAWAYYPAVIGDDSGLAAYATSWQANDGAFQLLNALVDPVPARAIAMILLLALAVWQAKRARAHPTAMCSAIGTVVLAMLLLGPTLYPWYYVPVIALAAAAGRWPLLAWTAFLPLVYVPADIVPAWLVALVVHLPIWVLLVVECARPNERPAPCSKTTP